VEEWDWSNVWWELKRSFLIDACGGGRFSWVGLAEYQNLEFGWQAGHIIFPSKSASNFLADLWQ